MIIMLTGRRGAFVICARTHALTQTICNIKCFLRSTDKKGKKSPGYRFDFWLFGERKEKRGREGRREGGKGRGGRRSWAKLLLSFLSFPWGSDWAAGAHAPAAAVEQLLVCRFENLEEGTKTTNSARTPR